MHEVERLQQRFTLREISFYFLVSLMLTCTIFMLVIFFDHYLNVFIPLLPIWGFLVVWEAFFTYRIAYKENLIRSSWLIYKGMEWVAILILLKVVLELNYSGSVVLHHLENWQQYFGSGFFTRDYLVASSCLSVIWVLSTLYAHDFGQMSDLHNSKIADMKRTPPNYSSQTKMVNYEQIIDENETPPSNRRSIYKRILNRTLLIGIGMVIFTAQMLRYQVADMPRFYIFIFGVQVFVILYFIFAFLLVSQSNFYALSASWEYGHTVIQPKLISRWLIYSLVFLCFTSVFAVMLPTSYSLGVVGTLNYLIEIVVIVVEFLIGVLVAPILLLLRLFSFLSSGGNPTTPSSIENQPRLPTETVVPSPSSQQLTIPFWDVMKSFIFWAVLLIIIGFVVYQYIHRNQAIRDYLKNIRLSHWANRVWRRLRALVIFSKKSVMAGIKIGIKKIGTLQHSPIVAAIPRWHYSNPSHLPPRQQVVFYYLTMLRRSFEAGYTRQPFQTPAVYGRILCDYLPGEKEGIMLITEAYIEARYSNHEVTSDQAIRVKKAWGYVRDILKHKRNLIPGHTNS